MSLLCSFRPLGGFVILVLCLLSACGQSMPRDVASGPDSAPLPQARSMPLARPVAPPSSISLPLPSALPAGRRLVSTEDALLLDAAATSPLLPANRVTPDFSVLEFDADYTAGGPISGLAIAGYEFSPFANSTDRVAKLKLYWQNKPLGTDWYVALANFDNNRWDFYHSSAFEQNINAPNTANFEVDNGEAYVDDANLRCLAAVILAGEEFGRLESLQVNNLDPVFVSADIPDTGNAGEEISFSALAEDPDHLAVTYVWDFGDGSNTVTDFDGTETHTFDIPGVYNVSVVVVDSEGGPSIPGASEQISILSLGNEPPTVSLTANGDENGVTGKRPLSVDFNAAANDPDGSIVKFEWDLDGDSVFELDSGTLPQQSAFYTNLATFAVSVRVTDNEAGQAVDSVQISTEGGTWALQPVASSSGRVLSTPKMALIGGRAAVVFQDQPDDFSDSDVAYCRSTTDDGDSAWGSVVSVEADAGGLLFAPTLAEVNNKPAVMYMRGSAFSIEYEQAVDAAGGDWTGTPVQVAPVQSFQFSLDIVNGFPAASYSVTGVFPAQELRYRRATDADGLNAWGTERVIDTDSAESVGATSSLEIVNGLPAVCYTDNTNGRLLFKRSLDSDGVAWGDVEIISDAGANTGANCSLFMVGGRPAAAFALTGSKPCYSRAEIEDGTSWPEDPPGLDENFINAGVFGAGLYQNLPCMAYQEFANRRVTFLLARDADGAQWNAPEPIADWTSVAGGNAEGSFLIVDGKPALAWSEPSSDTIRYAVYK